MPKVNHEIDVGLDALCRHAKRGQTLTSKEIAEVCGCSFQNIGRIEQTAIAKLRRNRLLKEWATLP